MPTVIACAGVCAGTRHRCVAVAGRQRYVPTSCMVPSLTTSQPIPGVATFSQADARALRSGKCPSLRSDWLLHCSTTFPSASFVGLVQQASAYLTAWYPANSCRRHKAAMITSEYVRNGNVIAPPHSDEFLQTIKIGTAVEPSGVNHSQGRTHACSSTCACPHGRHRHRCSVIPIFTTVPAASQGSEREQWVKSQHR